VTEKIHKFGNFKNCNRPVLKCQVRDTVVYSLILVLVIILIALFCNCYSLFK